MHGHWNYSASPTINLVSVEALARPDLFLT